MKSVSDGRIEEIIFRHAPFDRSDLWLNFSNGDAYDEFLLNAATDLWVEIVEPHEIPTDHEVHLDAGGESEEIYGPLLGKCEELISTRLKHLQDKRRVQQDINDFLKIGKERRLDILLSCEDPNFFSRKTLTKEAVAMFVGNNASLNIDNFSPEEGDRELLIETILSCFNEQILISDVQSKFRFKHRVFGESADFNLEKSLSESSLYQLLVQHCARTIYVISRGGEVDRQLEYPFHDVPVPDHLSEFIENMLIEDIAALMRDRLLEVAHIIDDGEDDLPF